MDIGVVYPQNELRGDPTAVRRIGKAVEDLGFDHLMAYDHVLGAVHAGRTRQLPGPYTEHDPFHDPFVDFSGRFDRVNRASLVPKPARAIPIWLGGSGEKAFDRAARLADGFIFFGGGIDHAVDAWQGLRDRVRRRGRSVEDFGGDYV